MSFTPLGMSNHAFSKLAARQAQQPSATPQDDTGEQFSLRIADNDAPAGHRVSDTIVASTPETRGQSSVPDNGLNSEAQIQARLAERAEQRSIINQLHDPNSDLRIQMAEATNGRLIDRVFRVGGQIVAATVEGGGATFAPNTPAINTTELYGHGREQGLSGQSLERFVNDGIADALTEIYGRRLTIDDRSTSGQLTYRQLVEDLNHQTSTLYDRRRL